MLLGVVGGPGGAGVVGGETVFVGWSPDGGSLGVFGVDAFDVFVGGGGELVPVFAAIGGEENGAGLADDPADLAGGGGAGGEIGGDAALLLLPGVAGVEAEFDFAVRPDAPGVGFGGEDDDAAAGEIAGELGGWSGKPGVRKSKKREKECYGEGGWQQTIHVDGPSFLGMKVAGCSVG